MNYGKKSTARKEKELTSKGTMVRKKFSVIFCKTLLICFFLAAVVGICAGIGIFKGIIDSAPDIDDIDASPTGQLSTVLDDEGNEIATLVTSGTNRDPVTIDKMPINLQHAFVAIEDERFYDHNGIDIKGIIRAGFKGIASGFHFHQGASTITQQLLKNNVFTDWTSEDSMADKFERKIQEQYLAIQLEKRESKNWILENYLNSINLGSNTLGVQAAAQRYFGKDVSKLTLSECAVIAGITKNPAGYNPILHPKENAKRRKNVLDAMKEYKLNADVIYACGPTPMLRALKAYAAEQGMTCYISMEERMACGIGACLACVCNSKEKDAHSNVKNKRICKEGPVFLAEEVDL